VCGDKYRQKNKPSIKIGEDLCRSLTDIAIGKQCYEIPNGNLPFHYFTAHQGRIDELIDVYKMAQLVPYNHETFYLD